MFAYMAGCTPESNSATDPALRKHVATLNITMTNEPALQISDSSEYCK
jgi:hypothetical protein